MASSFSAMAHMSLLSRRDTTAERWTLRSIRILAASRRSTCRLWGGWSCLSLSHFLLGEVMRGYGFDRKKPGWQYSRAQALSGSSDASRSRRACLSRDGCASTHSPASLDATLLSMISVIWSASGKKPAGSFLCSIAR